MVQHVETLARISKNQGASDLAYDLQQVAERHRGRAPETLEGVVVYERENRKFHNSRLSHDLSSRTVLLNETGELKTLTPTNNRLLIALEKTPGELRWFHELTKEVFGKDYSACSIVSLRQSIHSLRKQLETDPKHPSLIVSVRRYGYMLKDHGRENP